MGAGTGRLSLSRRLSLCRQRNAMNSKQGSLVKQQESRQPDKKPRSNSSESTTACGFFCQQDKKSYMVIFPSQELPKHIVCGSDGAKNGRLHAMLFRLRTWEAEPRNISRDSIISFQCRADVLARCGVAARKKADFENVTLDQNETYFPTHIDSRRQRL